MIPEQALTSPLGVRHGGLLYSICPPGSKVNDPPQRTGRSGALGRSLLSPSLARGEPPEERQG